MARPKYPSDDSAYQRKKWRSRPSDKKRRAERNAARAKAVEEGRAAKGDGKEVHHTNPNGKKGSLGKRTKVVSKAENRRIGHPKRKRKAGTKI